MNKRTIALKRSQFYQKIRQFFELENYVEVETPLLSPALIPESAIEVFATQSISPHGEMQSLYLTPSPEIYMKQLLAEGIGDCFQLCKSFRNAEQQGKRHQQEFTMLEWYSVSQNYRHNLKRTQKLLQFLASFATEETRHFFTEFQEKTMHELFMEFVNINLQQCQTLADFKHHATQAGFNDYALKADSWEALFHFIFISHIENKIPGNKTVFILDYPAQITTTAKAQNGFYERWEFYMKGWEIANCYSEETRFSVMQTLFEEEGHLKQQMQVPHKVDLSYLDIFKNNLFPHSSGCALGVDRLLAIALNAESLGDISLC